MLPDSAKLSTVKNFPTTKKVRDVQSFIGLAGYYRKFIKDFSKIAKPLTLTKKNTKFEWTTEQQKAFDILKEKLLKERPPHRYYTIPISRDNLLSR